LQKQEVLGQEVVADFASGSPSKHDIFLLKVLKGGEDLSEIDV
jgi:hypothetical protein